MTWGKVKVYKKEKIDQLIEDATLKIRHELRDICIAAVESQLNDMVALRDREELIRLEQRIQTLEIDSAGKEILRDPPKPVNNRSRKDFVNKLNGVK